MLVGSAGHTAIRTRPPSRRRAEQAEQAGRRRSGSGPPGLQITGGGTSRRAAEPGGAAAAQADANFAHQRRTALALQSSALISRRGLRVCSAVVASTQLGGAGGAE